MPTFRQLMKSRTVQLALVQAIAGIAIAVFTELDMAGWVAGVKSILDIYVRGITKEPLTAK